jgi:hypothetical protein
VRSLAITWKLFCYLIVRVQIHSPKTMHKLVIAGILFQEMQLKCDATYKCRKGKPLSYDFWREEYIVGYNSTLAARGLEEHDTCFSKCAWNLFCQFPEYLICR